MDNFLLNRRFYHGKRGRVVGVVTSGVFGPCLCVARSVLLSFSLLTPLIWPTPVFLRFQVGAVMYNVPDAFAVHALHVAAFVPRPQPAFDQLKS